MAEGSILYVSMAENLIHCRHGPMSTFNSLFFKILKFSAHLFRAWRHLHSSPISGLEFIMTMVIVISFARERKIVPNNCAPELRAK